MRLRLPRGQCRRLHLLDCTNDLQVSRLESREPSEVGEGGGGIAELLVNETTFTKRGDRFVIYVETSA